MAQMLQTITNRPWLTEATPAAHKPDDAWLPDPWVECACADASDAMCDDHAELILELI